LSAWFLTFACPEPVHACLTTACLWPWACLPSCTLASALDYQPLPAMTCRLPAPVVSINIFTSHSLHLGLTLIPDSKIWLAYPSTACLATKVIFFSWKVNMGAVHVVNDMRVCAIPRRVYLCVFQRGKERTEVGIQADRDWKRKC
jgi:hypothetical protein